MNSIYSIIVTYNAIKWIDRCIGSLLTSSNVHIVVVDNCSTDGTVLYIKEKYPVAYIIENKQNKGFGQANNQGIEYAYKKGATNFFLLNQDAWVEPDCISNLVEIQNHYNFAIVSPVHLNGLGDNFDYGFYEASVERIHNISFVSDIYLGQVKSFYYAEEINAAAWLLSKEAVEEIGGFDPLFFHYGEDINYCQRIRFHQKKMVFVPSAVIHHDRLQYGNIAVYNKGVVTMTLLLNHSNINNALFPLNQKYFKTLLSLWTRITKSFILFRWKEFRDLLCGIFKVYYKLFKIIRSRNANKIKMHNWLNL